MISSRAAMRRKHMRTTLLTCTLAAMLATSGIALAQATPPHIYYNERPNFVAIPGSHVMWWRNASNDYDVYRLGGDYYIQSNGVWYRGDNIHGDFPVTDEGLLPVEISSAVTYRARNGDRWATTQQTYDNSNGYDDQSSNDIRNAPQ